MSINKMQRSISKAQDSKKDIQKQIQIWKNKILKLYPNIENQNPKSKKDRIGKFCTKTRPNENKIQK